VLTEGQRIVQQRNETLVTRRYCRLKKSGQGLTASGTGYSWHETGETGKLPDAVILGSPAISREEHVKDSASR
jgi:hypothetical protein